MARYARGIPCGAVAALAAAVMLVWGLPAVAQVVQVGGQPARRPVRVQFPAIQGYYMLQMEHVQKELELADEQKKKLQKLTQQYYKDMRQDWSNVRELSAEERQAKYAEIRQKNQERTEQLRQEIDQVLLPHQREKLKQVNLRSRGPYMLRNANTLKQLGVTDEQQQKLNKLRERLQLRIRQLQEESFEESLEVLTPEQRKKLDELSDQGIRTLSGVRAAPQK